jgi:hypothetical protein
MTSAPLQGAVPAMSTNAMFFVLGSISTSAIGLAFILKWHLDSQPRHDLAWGVALICYGAAAAFAGVRLDPGSRPIYGIISVLMFWCFAAGITIGNLQYRGRRVHEGLVVIVCLAMGALWIAVAPREPGLGFVVHTQIAGLLFIWTGWMVRGLPRIGPLILALFAFRGLYVMTRPFLDGPAYRIPMSLLGLLVATLGGIALLGGSMLLSHERALRTKRARPSPRAAARNPAGDPAAQPSARGLDLPEGRFPGNLIIDPAIASRSEITIEPDRQPRRDA